MPGAPPSTTDAEYKDGLSPALLHEHQEMQSTVLVGRLIVEVT